MGMFNPHESANDIYELMDFERRQVEQHEKHEAWAQQQEICDLIEQVEKQTILIKELEDMLVRQSKIIEQLENEMECMNDYDVENLQKGGSI